LTSGLLPAAFIAIVLNLALPQDLDQQQTSLISGGLEGEDQEKEEIGKK
jgi:hypothetical protein